MRSWLIVLSTLVLAAAVPLAAPAQNLPAPPAVLLNTTYAAPVGGTIITVNAGDDLQAGLDAAQPGDIVELAAGASFTGNFILPNKPGPGWIYIRSSAVASLIAEGKLSQIGPTMESGRKYGMVPLNDALVACVKSGEVDAREAYRRAADRVGFLALLKRQCIDTTFVERPA